MKIKVISLAIFSLAVLSACAPAERITGPKMYAQETQVLQPPVQCLSPIDSTKRVYVIELESLEPNEIIRFIPKGPISRSRDYQAAVLLGKEVKLPQMTLVSREGGTMRGLWVERVSTGERLQLNYLPAEQRCNYRSIMIVRYDNLWVSLVEKES